MSYSYKKNRKQNKRNYNRGGDASQHAINTYGNMGGQTSISPSNNMIATKTGGGQLAPAEYKVSGGNLLPTVQNIAVPAVLLGTNQLYKTYSRRSTFRTPSSKSTRRRPSRRFRRRSLSRR